MSTLTGAAYCSQFAYKDPCCHNATDISICGAVPTMNLATTLTGAAYCSQDGYKDPCCQNASDISICGDVPKMNLATVPNDVTVTKFL